MILFFCEKFNLLTCGSWHKFWFRPFNRKLRLYTRGELLEGGDLLLQLFRIKVVWCFFTHGKRSQNNLCEVLLILEYLCKVLFPKTQQSILQFRRKRFLSPLRSDSNCKKAWLHFLMIMFLQGDSGGPLMCQRCSSCAWFLFGITSFGSRKCGSRGHPGVYTKISYYGTWINTVIGYDVTSGSFSSCTKN